MSDNAILDRASGYIEHYHDTYGSPSPAQIPDEHESLRLAEAVLSLRAALQAKTEECDGGWTWLRRQHEWHPGCRRDARKEGR